jgi:DNA replication protein DnaC
MTTIAPINDTAKEPDAFARLLNAYNQREKTTAQRLANYPKTQPCLTCKHPAEIDPNSLWDSETGAATEPTYRCAPCADRAAHERQVKHLIARQTAAGIPTDVRHATLENFRIDRPNVKTLEGYYTPSQFVEVVKALLNRKVRNVFLCGTVGIGKGHLAAAVLNSYLLRGHNHVLWVELTALFRNYHRAYEDKSTERVIAPLITVTMLVLDEICMKELPKDGEEILFAIVDGRHKANRPTLLLGNKPAVETRKWMGERVIDRLKSGGHDFLYGEWDSMRGANHDGATAEQPNLL